MGGLLDRALALSEYHQKRERFTRENPGRAVKKGIGLASFMHGAGFTGSGELHLASVVAVEGTPEGTVRVLSASTEIGQGTNTVFSQIAADALGIDCDDVDVVQPDTSVVPDSGPTVASRTCHGRRQAGRDRRARRQARADRFGLPAGGLLAGRVPAGVQALCRRVRPLARLESVQAASGLIWDDEKYVGDAYGTYGWAVYVAEVSVDTTTWETRV